MYPGSGLFSPVSPVFWHLATNSHLYIPLYFIPFSFKIRVYFSVQVQKGQRLSDEKDVWEKRSLIMEIKVLMEKETLECKNSLCFGISELDFSFSHCFHIFLNYFHVVWNQLFLMRKSSLGFPGRKVATQSFGNWSNYLTSTLMHLTQRQKNLRIVRFNL